ncbi:MAG: hypothetical protein IKH88_01440 [Prevotella sp.]|nr:hypothetical protein [Prevotella sp.]
MELHLPDTLVRMALAGIDSLCVVTLPTYCPDGHHPHAIDLGLPSRKKWACCNVGAHMPEHYGSYYAWGEVEEKDTYTWQNYPYAFYVDMDEMYVCHDIGDDISGTEYDAAFVNWGSPWCMPSKKDYQELINNCIYKRVDFHGVEGWLFSGLNNSSIFIPAAGWYGPAFHSDVANYWSSSSTPDLRKNRYASFLTIIMLGSNTLCNIVDNDRYVGKSVRAVTP